jgi:hypothetical protein
MVPARRSIPRESAANPTKAMFSGHKNNPNIKIDRAGHHEDNDKLCAASDRSR